MSEITAANTVLDNFKRLAEFNQSLGGLAITPDELRERDEIISAIKSEIVGHGVSVEELPGARTQKGGTTVAPIKRCGRATAAVPLADTRTYTGTTARFMPVEFFQYHRKSHGKAVGVDAMRACLVVRPKITGIFNRDWIRMTGDGGDPLVDLAILD